MTQLAEGTPGPATPAGEPEAESTTAQGAPSVEERLAALQAQVDKDKEERCKSDAASFVEALVLGGFLEPAGADEDLISAFDRIKTFVAPRTKRLLVVEDNDLERESIVELLDHDDIEIATVATGEEAFQALLDRTFDCCVLDLRLPDIPWRDGNPLGVPRQTGAVLTAGS